MRISCDSNYAVYINDALAAFGQYADYPWYKVYDEIELSTFFTVGVNCIKIIVWYYGENFSTYYKGKPGGMVRMGNWRQNRLRFLTAHVMLQK